MRRNEIYRIVVPYVCMVVVVHILADAFFDSESFNVMDVIIIALSVIALLLIARVLYATLRDIRDSNDRFNELWEQNDFDGCIAFARNELKKDIAVAFALNAKSKLVMTYYRIGDNEAGKKLLYATKWGIYESDVLYFFVLDCLACGDISAAKKYYRKLCHVKDDQKLQIDCCRQLLSIVEGKGELTSVHSIFPIVGEILEKQ